MSVWQGLQNYLGGDRYLTLWIYLFMASGILAGIYSGFFKARRIQPNRFRWEVFRREILFAAITIFISGAILARATAALKNHGFISYQTGAAHWWVIALEFALYFFAFDTYFYWLHRWMHRKSIYKWVHKTHHYSTAPNLLTTLSVHPLESLINGGFVPLFLAIFPVHQETMAFIGPCNIIMGFYVHCGHEFLPRWWNTSWLTRWFITATFHDQHHKYFNYNFGGYTPIWDWICGTVRPKYSADFDQLKARPNRSGVQAAKEQL
jgi:sterol desaturase/sphingolipid hydroxylase (fatty acid hydroxylase superfamily)